MRGEGYIPIPLEHAQRLNIVNSNATNGQDVFGKNLFRYKTSDGYTRGVLKAQGSSVAGSRWAKQFSQQGDLKAIGSWYEHKLSVKSARDQVLKTLYSICFCENPLNETLWLKYADNHRGFVVTYDFHSNDTYLCGKEDKCKNCPTIQLRPSIYPVYYSDDKYDASLYAVAVLLKISMMASGISAPQELATRLDSCMLWEIERISLLKKACHRFDEEWRMIYPQWCVARPCIRLKPKSVIIGLRTPQYKERLIISAATIAGITDIQKIQINKKDELEAVPV